MKSTTVQKTITILKHTHGIPEQLVTDNGSQFTSREFMKFMTNNGIKHIKTSPYHPSSNGVVERLVQSFKKAMKASYRENKTVDDRLAEAYRVTPHATTKVAPCELLLKCHIRTRLELLKPSVEHTVTNNQDKQTTKQDYEKQMRLFRPGQRVMIQNYRDATQAR